MPHFTVRDFMLCVAAAAASAAIWFLVPLYGGPLAQRGGATEGMCVSSNVPVTIGSAVLRDATFAPATILSVWAAPASPGLQVDARLLRTPPALGAMDGLPPFPERPPLRLPPLQRGARGAQVVLELRAARRGAYSVADTCALYRWLGHLFIARFPDAATYRIAAPGGCR